MLKAAITADSILGRYLVKALPAADAESGVAINCDTEFIYMLKKHLVFAKNCLKPFNLDSTTSGYVQWSTLTA